MVRKGSIKEKIICGLAYPLRWGMQVTYDILKVFPVRNRICFFSRQSDKVTRDFSLLQEELSRVSPGTEQKTICHRFRDIHDGAFGFKFHFSQRIVALEIG